MNSERAATLVEALAFTVVAVVFVLSAIAIFSMASSSADASAISRQLNSMQSDIHELFMRQPTYVDISSQLLIKAEVIPESLDVNGTQVSHNYGSGVLLFRSERGLGDGIEPGQATGDGAPDRRFSISYTGLPKSLCIHIASSVDGQFNQLDLRDPDGNLIGAIDDYGNTINFSDSNGLPLDTEEAQANCVEDAEVRYYSS